MLLRSIRGAGARVAGSRNFAKYAFTLKEQNPNLQGQRKYSNPEEYISQKNTEKVENEAYRKNLLGDEFRYDPRCLSEHHIDPVTKRPVPLNVRLLQYEPIQLPKTHGDEVANLVFKSYDEEKLTRASEFAARAASYLGIPCSKIKKLKTDKRLYTVIRSPFAQAKSKENFHRITYARKLEAFDATAEVVDLWLSFVNKYAIDGVQYNATFHSYESLDFNEKLDALGAGDLNMPEAYSDSEDPIAKKVSEILNTDSFKQYLDNDEDIKEANKKKSE